MLHSNKLLFTERQTSAQVFYSLGGFIHFWWVPPPSHFQGVLLNLPPPAGGMLPDLEQRGCFSPLDGGQSLQTVPGVSPPFLTRPGQKACSSQSVGAKLTEVSIQLSYLLGGRGKESENKSQKVNNLDFLPHQDFHHDDKPEASCPPPIPSGGSVSEGGRPALPMDTAQLGTGQRPQSRTRDHNQLSEDGA